MQIILELPWLETEHSKILTKTTQFNKVNYLRACSLIKIPFLLVALHICYHWLSGGSPDESLFIYLTTFYPQAYTLDKGFKIWIKCTIFTIYINLDNIIHYKNKTYKLNFSFLSMWFIAPFILFKSSNSQGRLDSTF